MPCARARALMPRFLCFLSLMQLGVTGLDDLEHLAEDDFLALGTPLVVRRLRHEISLIGELSACTFLLCFCCAAVLSTSRIVFPSATHTCGSVRR